MPNSHHGSEQGVGFLDEAGDVGVHVLSECRWVVRLRESLDELLQHARRTETKTVVEGEEEKASNIETPELVVS